MQAHTHIASTILTYGFASAGSGAVCVGGGCVTAGGAVATVVLS